MQKEWILQGKNNEKFLYRKRPSDTEFLLSTLCGMALFNLFFLDSWLLILGSAFPRVEELDLFANIRILIFVMKIWRRCIVCNLTTTLNRSGVAKNQAGALF